MSSRLVARLPRLLVLGAFGVALAGCAEQPGKKKEDKAEEKDKEKEEGEVKPPAEAKPAEAKPAEAKPEGFDDEVGDAEKKAE